MISRGIIVKVIDLWNQFNAKKCMYILLCFKLLYNSTEESRLIAHLQLIHIAVKIRI